jgi:hypothetical protein
VKQYPKNYFIEKKVSPYLDDCTVVEGTDVDLIIMGSSAVHPV